MDIKINNLKNHLVEQKLTKLERYLRELCRPFDKENKGVISLSKFMEIFQGSEKIILSDI